MTSENIENTRYWIHAQLDAIVSAEWQTAASDLDWLRTRAKEYAVSEVRRSNGAEAHGADELAPGTSWKEPGVKE